MRRYWIFILATGFWTLACQSGNHQTQKIASESEESPLYLEVMEIHDAVMPEMSTLHNLKKALNAILTEDNKEMVMHQMARIERADEAMMSWMAAFDVPEDSGEAETYLLSQKKEIQLVADSMNTVIRDVQTILQNSRNR